MREERLLARRRHENIVNVDVIMIGPIFANSIVGRRALSRRLRCSWGDIAMRPSAPMTILSTAACAPGTAFSNWRSPVHHHIRRCTVSRVVGFRRLAGSIARGLKTSQGCITSGTLCVLLARR